METIYIVIGIFQGVLDETKAFRNKIKAEKDYKKLCSEYEVPTKNPIRDDREVHLLTVDLEK